MSALETQVEEPLFAISKPQFAELSRRFLLELYGDNPKQLTPEKRDNFYRDYGMMIDFFARVVTGELSPSQPEGRE